MRFALVSICLLLMAVPVSASDTARAGFIDMHGTSNGEAGLVQTPAGVLIDVQVKGLPPGAWVAFHVHETGTCDGMAHFSSAGGHFNPTGAEHGFLAPNGPHSGDMPNQLVGADGDVRAQVLNANVSLGDGPDSIRGRALMIHAGEDDYKTDPSGNSGGRILCGVFARD